MTARYLSQSCAEAQPSEFVVAAALEDHVVSETLGLSAIALVRNAADFASIWSSEKFTESTKSGLAVEVVVEIPKPRGGHDRFAISIDQKAQRVIKAD